MIHSSQQTWDDKQMIRAIAIAMVLLSAMGLACDTIPDQDGCMTDFECETAWGDAPEIGGETLQK